MLVWRISGTRFCPASGGPAPEPPAVPAKRPRPAGPARGRREGRAPRLHMEKIERMKDAFRRGSPEQFVFDPADGPVPRIYYHIDGTTDFS